jgi:hypothetical protein
MRLWGILLLEYNQLASDAEGGTVIKDETLAYLHYKNGKNQNGEGKV